MPTKDSSEERKAKNRDYMRSYRARNPEKSAQFMRSFHYQRMYGLTMDDYNKLLAAQGGVCFLCKNPETRTRNGEVTLMSVDHDHSCCPDRKTCGKCIRRLLCFSCNTLVGRMESNKEVTKRALDYIGGVE